MAHEERITTGVPALDEMMGGGLLPRQMVLVTGPPGAGKTIALLQFTLANLQQGRRCLYVSSSDDPEMVVENSLRFGWNFKPYLDSGQLRIVTFRLMDTDAGLTTNIRETMPRTIRESKADIVVIDSVTEFQDMCATDLERKGWTMELRWTLRDMGATALVAAEASGGAGITKYGIAEYVSDGIILLSRFTSEDTSEFVHVIQVLKMRWIQHSKELRAYRVTSKGLDIMSPIYTVLAAQGKKRESL
ncbi:MAG: AAA family ATPase [Euryarchaeota archaeon]|nr:AAA family ATPase [Euryarchaeota archaeon]